VGAQNFNFALKFSLSRTLLSINLAFLDNNFSTTKSFSDSFSRTKNFGLATDL